MSILTTDLIAYGCASRPTDDVSTTGGAIDATTRPVFTQFGANAKLSLTSDGTDTRNVTITGRDAGGAYITETVALTNAVEVLSANTYERILSVIAASSSGTRTVTCKQGSGGSVIATIPVNEVGFYAMFINAASDPSVIKTRYEKLFWKNTNGSLTLTSSQVTLTADPSAVTQMGIAGSLNDSATVANRLAAPGGITFVGTGVAQNVPNSQNLTSGAGIGVWIKQTLAAANAALRSTFTTQLSGNTT
jgi:hypothetical protein